MSTITGDIKLSALTHVIKKMKNKEGQEFECIVIPIEKNKLYHNKEKGLITLNWIAFDSVKEEYKQTHAIKQSFTKEERDRQKKEEINTPFIGNMNTNFGGSASNNSNVASGVVLDEDDDVPF